MAKTIKQAALDDTLHNNTDIAEQAALSAGYSDLCSARNVALNTLKSELESVHRQIVRAKQDAGPSEAERMTAASEMLEAGISWVSVAEQCRLSADWVRDEERRVNRRQYVAEFVKLTEQVGHDAAVKSYYEDRKVPPGPVEIEMFKTGRTPERVRKKGTDEVYLYTEALAQHQGMEAA
ncbi:MAG: hypothetical protein R3F37_16695 [Candidatus Competibacteraceae bacterium]